MTRYLTHRGGAGAGLLIGALLLSGCSSGSNDDDAVASGGVGAAGPTASSSSTSSSEETALKFSQCMRENGVASFPDPTVGSDGAISFDTGGDGLAGVDSDTLDAASSACEEYSSALGGDFDTSSQSGLQDSLVAYAQCMRENGYQLADPDFSQGSGPGALSEFASSIDRSDPAFTSANAACESNLAGLGAP